MPKKEIENTLPGQAQECVKKIKEMNKEILKELKREGKMIKKFIEKMYQLYWVSRVKETRKTMRHIFETDKNLKQTYISNIAMLFYDRYGKGNYITNHKKRNQAAEDILNLIFRKE